MVALVVGISSERTWSGGSVASAGHVYEKSGTLMVGTHLSGSAELLRRLATGLALIAVGARVIQQQATHAHYHPEHHHYGDVLGAALTVTLGLAVIRRTFKL